MKKEFWINAACFVLGFLVMVVILVFVPQLHVDLGAAIMAIVLILIPMLMGYSLKLMCYVLGAVLGLLFVLLFL